jgi:hypothetical protein
MLREGDYKFSKKNHSNTRYNRKVHCSLSNVPLIIEPSQENLLHFFSMRVECLNNGCYEL